MLDLAFFVEHELQFSLAFMGEMLNYEGKNVNSLETGDVRE